MGGEASGVCAVDLLDLSPLLDVPEDLVPLGQAGHDLLVSGRLATLGVFAWAGGLSKGGHERANLLWRVGVEVSVDEPTVDHGRTPDELGHLFLYLIEMELRMTQRQITTMMVGRRWRNRSLTYDTSEGDSGEVEEGLLV